MWESNKKVRVHIVELIEKLGDNFESIITSYFEDFKKSMKERLRIHVSLVEKCYNDVYFLVDVNYTYV